MILKTNFFIVKFMKNENELLTLMLNSACILNNFGRN